MQKKIIRQYYILSCLFNVGGLSIVSAVYVDFLMGNGLNLLQVNLANAVFFVTLFVCEIPTGAFADIFGRKTSFVVACGIMSASMFVYGLSHTFFGFALAEMLGAIGLTFRSGAFQAWLIDSLKHHGYEGEYNRILGKEGFIWQIGGGIGAIAGSYLAVYHPALPWFFGGAVLAVTTAYAFLVMEEEYFVRKAFSFKRGLVSMREVAVSSIRYGTQNQAVRFILVITCLMIFAVQPLNMYWQPYFRDHQMSKQHLGFLFTGMMLALAAGAFAVSRLELQGREKKFIIWSQVGTGLLVLMTLAVPGLPLMAVMFILHEVPRGCLNPLVGSYLQKRIPSDERATISSFCAIAPHIGGAVGLILSGLLAYYFGIGAAWTASAIALIVGSLLIARNGKGRAE